MKRTAKVVEARTVSHVQSDPYQQVAIYVRQLLQCDYALLVVPEKDSIRVQGFAGADGLAGGAELTELISQLRSWGPVVVDDARLIAVPVSSGNQLMGVLIGYSSKPGSFTTEHLERLTVYAPVALGIISNASVEARQDDRTLSADELRHLFRLITIGEFSACFAHEVRNPLTLIRGHLRFITESLPADHALRSNVDAIDRASRRIEEMAKRMLDFSKKRTRHTEPCEIADLLADAMRFVQPYIRARAIDVEVHLEPQLPPLEADRWQVVQAIVNILQNAADAMTDASQRLLTVVVSVAHGRLRIAISDTGSGILPGNISRIFEPFFTTKNERGTGLGLYITKQVVEEHRGVVTVDTGNRGTTFTIALPLNGVSK